MILPGSKCMLKNDSTLSFPDYDDKSLLVNDIARFFCAEDNADT